MAPGPRPDDDEAAVRLGLAIKRIRARMRAESSTAGGWTISQLSTLARIVDHTPVTAAAIAQAEHVRPQSIASIVATLREAGLVATEPDPADGRKVLLSPTAAGRALVASVSTSRQEWLRARHPRRRRTRRPGRAGHRHRDAEPARRLRPARRRARRVARRVSDFETTIPEAGRLRTLARTTFSSLRVRNFRLFFIGQLISNSGNWLTNVALTLLVLQPDRQRASPSGCLVTCQYGPMLLFSAYGGTVADRVDKRRMLFVTQAGEMLQSVVLAVLAFAPHPPLAAFYVTAAVGGVLLAFDNPARRSFVSEMVPPEELPNAVVLYSTIVNVSRILGPTLAGLLVVTVGYGWCFTIDALSYVFVIAALWMMRPAELRRTPVRPRQKGEIRAALRYVADAPHLRITFAMLGVVGLLAYNFNVTLPLLVIRSLGGSDGAFTLIYATFAAGAVVSALVVANRNLVRVRHVVVGSVFFAISMGLLAVVPSVAAAVPVAFLVGLSSILYMTSTTAIVQVEADQSMHGRILALQTVLLGRDGAARWPAARLGGRRPRRPSPDRPGRGVVPRCRGLRGRRQPARRVAVSASRSRRSVARRRAPRLEAFEARNGATCAPLDFWKRLGPARGARRHPRRADGRPAVTACSSSVDSRISRARSSGPSSSTHRSKAILKMAMPASAARLAAGSATPRRRNASATADASDASLISSRSWSSGFSAMIAWRARANGRRSAKKAATPPARAETIASRGGVDGGAASTPCTSRSRSAGDPPNSTSRLSAK